VFHIVLKQAVEGEVMYQVIEWNQYTCLMVAAAAAFADQTVVVVVVVVEDRFQSEIYCQHFAYDDDDDNSSSTTLQLYSQKLSLSQIPKFQILPSK